MPLQMTSARDECAHSIRSVSAIAARMPIHVPIARQHPTCGVYAASENGASPPVEVATGTGTGAGTGTGTGAGTTGAGTGTGRDPCRAREDISPKPGRGRTATRAVRAAGTHAIQQPMGRTTRSSETCADDINQVLLAAHGVIRSVPYELAPSMHPATFITFDSDGYASARVLVPRVISEDLSTITLNTRVSTRKVSRKTAQIPSIVRRFLPAHIDATRHPTPIMREHVASHLRQYEELENDERATLTYHDQRGKQGWLTLKGNAARSGAVKPDGTVDVHFVTTALEIMTYNEDLTFENARPIVIVRTDSGASADNGWKLKT